MRILVVVSGEYGRRHAENIRQHGPDGWTVETWQAPVVLPLIVDYPEDYLPDSLPEADLVCAFHELKTVAELLPDIARMAGAKAVLAPIDNEAWLPRGLARQLVRWLGDIGVGCATPKPLCSLTEDEYIMSRSGKISYNVPEIAEFARYFGKPSFDIEIDPETRTIVRMETLRDAVCGCGRFVADKLIGVHANDAEEKAGLAHHHYPCLASMGKDPAFNDTLMHISGNILKLDVAKQVKPYKEINYITPGKLAE